MNGIYFAHAGHDHMTNQSFDAGTLAIAIVGLLAVAGLAAVFFVAFSSYNKVTQPTSAKSRPRKK